jgi:hypothetical protein
VGAASLRKKVKKKPRVREAFYFGFNPVNFAASFPVKVRT